jgi:hypothetical protein
LFSSLEFRARDRRGWRRELIDEAPPLDVTALVAVVAAACSTGTGATAGAQGGCRNLTVTAAKDIAPALSTAAAAFNGTKVDGRCVRVRIDARSSDKVSDSLSGTVVNPTAPKPDAWVPESSLWISTVRRTSTGASIASSPIVWAMSAQLAKSGGKANSYPAEARRTWTTVH